MTLTLAFEFFRNKRFALTTICLVEVREMGIGRSGKEVLFTKFLGGLVQNHVQASLLANQTPLVCVRRRKISYRAGYYSLSKRVNFGDQ